MVRRGEEKTKKNKKNKKKESERIFFVKIN